MRQFIHSVILISILSAAAAFITFKVSGAPDRSVPCDQASLPEHFVCLSTVREWPPDQILWVDARPRKDWEKDGVQGSVLVNDQEEWIDLEFGFMSKMNEGLKPRVVVYCNQSGCGSSKYVAEQLRQRHAETFGFQVSVLEGGIKALRDEK